jgi:hypothetical protein
LTPRELKNIVAPAAATAEAAAREIAHTYNGIEATTRMPEYGMQGGSFGKTGATEEDAPSSQGWAVHPRHPASQQARSLLQSSQHLSSLPSRRTDNVAGQNYSHIGGQHLNHVAGQSYSHTGGQHLHHVGGQNYSHKGGQHPGTAPGELHSHTDEFSAPLHTHKETHGGHGEHGGHEEHRSSDGHGEGDSHGDGHDAIATTSLVCEGKHGHNVHVLAHWCHIASIVILSIFEIELLLKIWVHPRHFFSSKLHMLDLIVVTLSLTLDLFLKQIVAFFKDNKRVELGFDIASSILLCSRLWRVARVFHGIFETAHKAYSRVCRLTQENKRLQEKLKHLESTIPLPKAGQSQSADANK